MHSYGTEKINVREYRRGNQYWTIQRNGNIVYTRHGGEKQNKTHNTICVGHHYIQTNRNNINQTWVLVQATGGKDEPNIDHMRKS